MCGYFLSSGNYINDQADGITVGAYQSSGAQFGSTKVTRDNHGYITKTTAAQLERAQPEPSDTGRDPFRFEAALAPAPKGGPAGPGVVATPPPQPAAPLEPPGPPPIPLKFIWIARQGQGRLLAVLRDERGIYYGAEGDVVEGRYRILRVSVELVEMAYLDGRGRTSIPLSGGRP